MNRAALSLVILLACCGTRAPVVLGDFGGQPDAAGPDRRLPANDVARPVDQGRPHETKPAFDTTLPAGDYGLCTPCKTGEVYLLSACVTTDKLFTCAPPCSAGSCPPSYKCDQWGGTPCCYCQQAVGACVPVATIGGLAGPLRISPVDGPAGQKVTLTISGAPFYIGALFYSARMGSETVMYGGAGGSDCSFTATFTPAKPGIYPVEVSQYGGGAPWVLAGFFTATGGVTPMTSIQPGYSCPMNPKPGDPPCIAAPPYGCGCFSGRCVCK